MALIEIQYPHNWMNITKDVYIIFIFDTKSKETNFPHQLVEALAVYREDYEKELIDEFKLLKDKGQAKKIENDELTILCARIPKGYYANVGELISKLNQEIEDSLAGHPDWLADRDKTKEVNLLYRFNAIERRVQGFQMVW